MWAAIATWNYVREKLLKHVAIRTLKKWSNDRVIWGELQAQQLIVIVTADWERVIDPKLSDASILSLAWKITSPQFDDKTIINKCLVLTVKLESSSFLCPLQLSLHTTCWIRVKM